MTTFLITGTNEEEIASYIKQFCQTKQIDPLDITCVTATGIEDIRILRKPLFFMPIKSKEKITILYHAEGLTIEAQNALLKILEEPPHNTYIMLTAPQQTNFLPTILSRCSIIALQQTRRSITNEKHEAIHNDVINLFSGGIATKLALAESLAKDKEQSLIWLEEVMFFLRDLMHEFADTDDAADCFFALKAISDIHTTIKSTNVNVRLALEYLFLSL